MGTRRRPSSDELPLFDLPLHPGEAADDSDEASEPSARADSPAVASPKAASPKAASRPPSGAPAGPTAHTAPTVQSAARPKPETPSLFGPEEFEASDARDDFGDDATAHDHGDDAWLPVEVTLQDRLLGGFLDLALNLIVFGLVVLVVRLPLGVPVRWDDWPAFAIFGLIFTFLYWTVPLAFWGQTPGMAWAGHAARSVTDEPLTFGQTVLRWIGSLLTVGFAGLPLLLVLFGSRSLSDRLSDSKTLEV